MIADFVDALGSRIADLARQRRASGFAVAFSGGLDSSVLLAVCAQTELGVPLRALHVNHGLHDESGAWAAHCATEAERLAVEFECVDVEIPRATGHSVEALARERRYAAFAARLHPREMLLTAHHADDQLETLLLRLFRGTGVRGLRGILPIGELGAGSFGRPMLEVSKADIVAAAQALGLPFVDDPSNAEQRFDRNFLRHRIVPVIRERWPSAARTVGRTARHLGDAQTLLDEIAIGDAMGLSDPRRLSLVLLRGLDAARQRNVVRAAVTAAGLPAPTTEQLAALLAAIDRGRRDAAACVRWPGGEAHLYRDHLHLMAELPARSRPGASNRISTSEPWSGPEGDLALVAVEMNRARSGLSEDYVCDGLDVRFRTGGERLKPAFGDHHRKLKTLFQEHGIVPWMRQRIPLLYCADRLVAVGDLWISDEARARESDRPAWRVRWTGHPALH